MLGLASQVAGDHARAVEAGERALAALEAAGVGALEQADVRFLIARSAWEIGRHESATEHAAQALAAYRTDPSWADTTAEIEAWQRAHAR
jgi:hypothetical protein